MFIIIFLCGSVTLWCVAVLFVSSVVSTIVAVRLLHESFACSKMRPRKRANIQFLHANDIAKAVWHTTDFIDPMRGIFSTVSKTMRTKTVPRCDGTKQSHKNHFVKKGMGFEIVNKTTKMPRHAWTDEKNGLEAQQQDTRNTSADCAA